MGREEIRFGDLVVVIGDPARGVGFVADARRSDCRVVHLATGRSSWVQRRDLRRAPSGEIEGTLEKLTADMTGLLGAMEMELDSCGGGRYILRASHGAIAPDVIDRLRAMLGPRLRACLIRPQGMHRIQTLVEFTF